MALNLQESGSHFRPGLIGRGVRLAGGLGLLYAVSPLLGFRPGATLTIGDIGLWVGVGFAVWLANDVVNIGFGRDFGDWPRYSVIGLIVLGSVGDFYMNGIWWAEIVSSVIAVELLLILGYLGVSFLVAAALAVPG